MRNYEYTALHLYTEDYKKKDSMANMTSVLRGILFGDIPPIPESYIKEGKIKIKEAEKNKKEQEVSLEKKPSDKKDIIGGGIFTF